MLGDQGKAGGVFGHHDRTWEDVRISEKGMGT